MTNSGTFAPLGEIGRVLAAAMRGQPWLAFTGIIAIVGMLGTASIAIALRNEMGLYLLPVFLLVLVGVGGLGFSRQLKRQRAQIDLEPSRPAGKTPMQFAHELSDGQKGTIREILRGAAEAAARTLNVSPDHVRCNVFALDADEKLRIVPEFAHNMSRPEELSVAFTEEMGVVGAARRSRRPVFAQYSPGWGRYAIPDSELAKTDPRLRWIVSLPVFDETGNPAWALNVDGVVDEVSEGDLRMTTGTLANWYGLLALTFAGAGGNG